MTKETEADLTGVEAGVSPKPAVDVIGAAVDRPDGQEAILVTRFLDSSYRS